MGKIICDYCKFGTKDNLCYKGGMDNCKGELFECKTNDNTSKDNCNLADVNDCGLLKKAEHMRNEQQHLIDTYADQYNSYSIGTLNGIDRVVRLIQRHCR